MIDIVSAMSVLSTHKSCCDNKTRMQVLIASYNVVHDGQH